MGNLTPKPINQHMNKKFISIFEKTEKEIFSNVVKSQTIIK